MRKAAIICKFKSEKLKKNLKRAEALYFKNSNWVGQDWAGVKYDKSRYCRKGENY